MMMPITVTMLITTVIVKNVADGGNVALSPYEFEGMSSNEKVVQKTSPRSPKIYSNDGMRYFL